VAVAVRLLSMTRPSASACPAPLSISRRFPDADSPGEQALVLPRAVWLTEWMRWQRPLSGTAERPSGCVPQRRLILPLGESWVPRGIALRGSRRKPAFRDIAPVVCVVHGNEARVPLTTAVSTRVEDCCAGARTMTSGPPALRVSEDPRPSDMDPMSLTG